MYSITKEFDFSAAHQLRELPLQHPCSRLHGHNYAVRVIIYTDTLDSTGFVVDFGELTWFRNLINQEYDHRCLNDVVTFNPTAELLAQHLALKVYRWLREFDPSRIFDVTLGVAETPKTWAFYTINDRDEVDE